MGLNISRGTLPRCQRVVIYGPEGVGKTTFAAAFPDPLLIDAEGGSGHIDVARFDRPWTWGELMEQVQYVQAKQSVCKTLVLDTLDWAERLCSEHVCKANGWQSLDAPGFGRGYVEMRAEFAKLLDALSVVVDRGVTVVCTAHARIDKFEPPDQAAPYDRWALKLNDSRRSSTAALVKEWADALLFANFKTTVETSSTGKVHGSTSKRVLYCNHGAAYDAKNRWGLPDVVPFEYASIAAHVEPKPADEQRRKGLHDRLAELMAADGVDDGALRTAVASQGYAALNQRVEDYGEELLARLADNWESVKALIAQQAEEAPF